MIFTFEKAGCCFFPTGMLFVLLEAFSAQKSFPFPPAIRPVF
jgi:hypothetical protein